MLKSLVARIAGTTAVLALAGSTLPLAFPADTANALPKSCYGLGSPDIRATVSITVPPGSSAKAGDLLNVKVQNTTNQDCYYATLVITPREGTVFAGVVSTTGGWDCYGPGIGETGDTYCYNEIVPKYSQQTVKVRYNRAVYNGPVSGTASAEVYFSGCGAAPIEDGVQALC